MTALPPLFPKAARDRLPHPPGRLRAARRRARRRGAGGRREADPHGRHRCRRAAAPRSPRPSASRRCRPRSAATQQRAGCSTRRSCTSWARTRAAPRSARRGWTTTATGRRARPSGAPSRPRSSWPARSASRSSSTPARRPRTRSTRSSAALTGLRVILHCFSMPEELDACSPAGLVDLLRRQRDLRSAGDLAAAAARVPAERLLVETDAPYLAPRSRRGSPTSRPRWWRRRASSPSCAASSRAELERELERNAAALFGW